ncbi:MAG: hypothetical protein ACI4DK_12325 [Lachnospiraceae bacterium]
MTKTLAKTFDIMPSNFKIILPPTLRFFSGITEGSLVKMWITDDNIIHIQKVTECDEASDFKSSVSVESIVELLDDMSNDDKVKVIKSIAPSCFFGGTNGEE